MKAEIQYQEARIATRIKVKRILELLEKNLSANEIARTYRLWKIFRGMFDREGGLQAPVQDKVHKIPRPDELIQGAG